MTTPAQLRAELEELVWKDLLGPAGGPEEIIDEPTVSGRYVVGVLAPKGHTPVQDDPEEELADPSDLALGAETTSDPEEPPVDSTPPKAMSMLPSSIGLTFTVDGQAQAIQVTARWGRYVRQEHPDPAQVTKRGIRRLVWRRIPITGTSTPFPLKQGPLGPWSPNPEQPAVTVRGVMRQRDNEWSVTLYLTNGQPEPKARSGGGKDSAWLFQPELIIEAPPPESPAETASAAAAIFCKRPRLRDAVWLEEEELAMQMSYRREVEFAVGHGVAVQAELATGDWERAIRLTTQVMPSYELAKTLPPTPDEVPGLANVTLDMRTLAETEDVDFAQALGGIVQAYRTWIEEQAGRVAHPSPDLALYGSAAQATVEKAWQTLARIEAGIAQLTNDPQAAEAFRFANRAMWQQRIHSLYAQQQRQGQTVQLEAFDRPENRRWYPFQLAFILLNIPPLTDIHHPDRSDPTQAVADLLWFPTGGGKTEAYLGLTAYTLALRRLQGVVDGKSGLTGVAVLMRYTLRLLTLQQFQRATALICACEEIRQQALAAGDSQWGAEPFRIGLWVGASSTPNSTEASAEALKKDNNSFGGSRGTPYQLTACPWCGSEINLGRDLRVEPYEKGRGRTLMFCGDPLGCCRFSRKKSPDEGLPVIVVDEEIYRRLPALLIATVDKFAQMPWKGETQMLFGRVSSYCSRHGYCSPELTCAGSHRAAGHLPAATNQSVELLRPPDLIIQDELHLISGPLGTLVGLYETVIDALCTWEAHGQQVRPKVIASTATIRRAAAQVNQLYLRQVNVFPPAGLDANDNFFARRRPPSAETPGRYYVGICAPGVRVKALLIRLYVATMAAAQKLYEQYGVAMDPYMTQVGYFNAVRELGGMRRAVDDAVSTRLRRANERGLARRYIEHRSVEELTSRKSAADIPAILDRLEMPFDPANKKERPLDVLLATNMISVGVDVSRLGLMVVAGQPKTTSEYIQATSRVGRRHPGLVYVVYNWARPRDLSHYERFTHYHATFYQHVEPLSVTPFSPRALDRGLTGVLAAYIRLFGTAFNDNLGAGRITADHPYVKAAVAEISQRAGLIEGDTTVADEVRHELEDRVEQWLARVQQTKGGAQLGYQEQRDGVTRNLLKSAEGAQWDDFVCLNSLREVEPGVGLILDNHGMAQQVNHTPATSAATSREVNP